MNSVVFTTVKHPSDNYNVLHILYICVYKYIYIDIYMYRLPSSPYPPPVPGCGGPASVGTPKPGTWKPFVTLSLYIYIKGQRHACKEYT